MTERVSQLYDRIGVGYRELRRPDPRIAAAILRSLAGSETVVNVGARAGSYEPSDQAVVAVEPSMTMIRQRGDVTVPVVQASATELSVSRPRLRRGTRGPNCPSLARSITRPRGDGSHRP